MIWTQIRFYYILIFWYSKMSNSFLKIHQKSQNDVLCGNKNVDVSHMSGNYAIGPYTEFLSKYFTHLWKWDRTEGATEMCAVKISVPNFQKI